MHRKVTRLQAGNREGRNTLTFAVMPDLHNGPFEDSLREAEGCDAILVPGDILDRHRGGTDYAMRFLEEAPDVAPVFFSVGNHESRNAKWPSFREKMEASRVTLLDDRFVAFRGLVIGGLSSREVVDHKLDMGQREGVCSFLHRMKTEGGYTLLLCHHPEYYPAFIAGEGIDLTLSGHAHGGQVCLFGRGLYAPGQGLFPSLTAGFYDDGHLLVSRGMTNNTWAPRWFNPCEMILLTVSF